MIKKIIKYLVDNQKNLRDFVAILLFKANIIPKEFQGRARSIYLTKKYDKEFKNLSLNYDNLGFHSLSPMPSENFLEKYYKDTYWQSRTDKDYSIRLRDIEHYKLLKKRFPDFDNSRKNILNFGAGHGGLSFFLHVAKHQIYNFEPGGIKEYFSERWESIEKIDDLNLKFDLIYGSHTLEHVQDIKKTLKILKNISHEKTIFFFEVPNCYSKNTLKVEPPHTYYFTRKFFKNAFTSYDYCKTFRNYTEQKDDGGEVIVFLSQSQINEKII